MHDGSTPIAHAGADAIASYIRAKDGNRPDLMASAFAEDAVLEMAVHTSSMSFPPLTRGRAEITAVLVERFAEQYEDVHTYCLAAAPPAPSQSTFSCPWLVGMLDKGTKAVRVGCGRYDWSFRLESPRLADRLVITIDVMQVLPASSRAAVMQWLRGLPYPWCEARRATESAPALEALIPVLERLDRG